MIKVNPIYLDDLLAPLIGGADHEDEIVSFSRFNVELKNDIEYLAKHYLIPSYQQQIPEIQLEVKRALAFYLCYGRVDFEAKYNSLLLPLDTPSDARQFFLWLWEFFFHNESYDFIKTEEVEEDFDVEAPQKLIKSIKDNIS